MGGSTALKSHASRDLFMVSGMLDLGWDLCLFVCLFILTCDMAYSSAIGYRGRDKPGARASLLPWPTSTPTALLTSPILIVWFMV